MSAEQISETVGRVSAFTQSYVCRVVQTSRGRRLTTLHLGTEQEAFTHFSWPIEGAHKAVGGVTGVAVVADRLLISVGRDAAAKVYALPSGTYRRTLRSDRRLPLTAIMVDEARHRVLTGSSDGALAIYDLLDPEMSLLQHVQSGLGVSTFFAPLPHATMNRFLVLHAPTYFTPEDEVALMTEMQPIESSSGKDDSSMLIPYSTSATRGEKRKGDAGPQRRSGPKAIPKMLMTSVVQFDARGPQGSAVKGSEPLGQPTAAEQSNALKLATLQLESLANRQLIHHARRMGTNEDVHDVRELRKASLLMQRCHHRAFGLRCFFRWQRWAARRTKLLERLTAVEFLRDTAHEAVIHSYFGKWQQFHRERLAEKWRAKIQGIHGRGDVAPSSRNLGAMTTSSHTISVLTVDQALCNARRTKLWHVASFLNLKRNTEQLRCAFQTWSTGVRAKILRERREMAFNRLLLLLSGNHYNTSTLAVEYFARHSVKASRMTRALWLLTLPESHGELGPQQELLCRRYLHSWRRWTEERRREEMAASSWNLVMPLSATLVRTEEIRRRYYLKWLTHACFVVKGSRIEEEAHTLSREWLSLQNAADNPCSFQELQREEEEHQLVLIQLGDDLEAAEAQERHYQHELKSLQVSHALRILLGGYSGSLVSSGEDGTSAYMGGGGGYDSTPRRHHQRLTSGGSSPCSSVSNFRPLRQALMVDADDDFRSGPSVATGNGLASLRFDPSQVVAALRVLKAYTLNFGREERPFATAHALALKLPIPEPIGGEVAELNNSQGSVSLMSGGGARPSAGSIHPRVRSTGSWSVTMTSGAAAAPHSAFPTSAAAAALGRGRGSTGRSSGNAPSSATAATLSPAAMWSSAPAERSYASLADAFDATVQQLLQGLADAAREAGLELDDCILRLSEAVVASHVGTSTVEGGDGRTTPTRSTRSSRPRPVTEWMTSEAMDCNQTLPQPRQLLPAAYATSVESDAHRRPPSADSAVVDPSSSIPSWVRQFSPKVRKDLLPLVARLVTLADSYTAHSEATLESSGGTISTRGAASVRPLPLVCLCGERWAQELLRYAPVLLLVLSPKVWTRQLYLQRLQQLADTSVQEDDRCSSIPDASFRTRSIASDGPTRPGNMSHYEWDTPADFRPSPAANRPTPRRLSSELLQRPASMSVLHQIDERESSLGVTSQASYHIPPPPAPQWPEHLPPPTFSGGGNPIHPHHHHHRTMYSYSKPGSVQVEDDVDDDRSVKSMSVRSFSVASTGGSMSVTPRSMTPGGTISRPYLGFRVSVSRDGGGRSVISIKEIAGSFLNAEGKEAEGPAAAANLRVGDHLHRFAGYAVTDLAAFNAIVTRHVRPGVELPMVIIRDGESIPLTIRVGQRLG